MPLRNNFFGCKEKIILVSFPKEKHTKQQFAAWPLLKDGAVLRTQKHKPYLTYQINVIISAHLFIAFYSNIVCICLTKCRLTD